ncbi:hypothetical protein [Victivallis vadensis]|uniref:hypothetical protein n=1 Tax=Victivallis vadensis TaxID=172901 RepID=UPI00307EF47A
MKITGKKLAEALSALGKLTTRTSPVELHQAVLLEARGGQLSLRTVAQDESLTVTIPAEGAADFRHAVHYAKLRELTRNPAGTVTFMELNDGFAAQLECRRKIVTHVLPVLNIDWPEAEAAPAEAETAALPENFTALLSEAAPLVNRNEARHQLRGIHLCPEGIAATDGKQLLHLPLDWTLKSPVTLPFPLALLTAKPEVPGTLTVWKLKDIQFFKIEVGGFLWSGKTVSGSYPEWRKVIPEASALNYAIAFTPEQAAQLTGFLKTVPDHEPFHAIELKVVPGGVTVVPNNFPDMELRLKATVIGAQPRAVLALNKYILLRMLQLGYTKFQAHSDGRIPVIAEGGSGRYLAMPIHILPKHQPEKETSKMENIKRIEHTETATVEAAEPVNPMEELNHSIEDLRGKLRTLLDESALLARKVKEAVLQQKQREREFVQAKRAIERIRMAI